MITFLMMHLRILAPERAGNAQICVLWGCGCQLGTSRIDNWTGGRTGRAGPVCRYSSEVAFEARTRPNNTGTPIKRVFSVKGSRLSRAKWSETKWSELWWMLVRARVSVRVPCGLWKDFLLRPTSSRVVVSEAICMISHDFPSIHKKRLLVYIENWFLKCNLPVSRSLRSSAETESPYNSCKLRGPFGSSTNSHPCWISRMVAYHNYKKKLKIIG